MKCLCSNYACFYRCSNHRICFRLLYKVKYLEGTNHLEFNEQKLKSNKMKPVINNESIKEAHENKINYSLIVQAQVCEISFFLLQKYEEMRGP